MCVCVSIYIYRHIYMSVILLLSYTICFEVNICQISEIQKEMNKFC